MGKTNLGIIVAYRQAFEGEKYIRKIRIKFKNSVEFEEDSSKGVYISAKKKPVLIDANDEYDVPADFDVLLNQSCIFELNTSKKEVISLEYVTSQAK